MYRVIRRKWRTFVGDPVGAIRHYERTLRKRTRRPYTLAKRRSFQQAARLLLWRRGALGVLCEFMEKRPAGAYPPDFCDLLYLYDRVRERKPSTVLEFGSGCSTVVMAQALWDNSRKSHRPSGRLYSVDGQEYWANTTADRMPAHLAGLCEIIHSPVREIEVEGVTGLQHVHVPDVVPDFVYLDGPDYRPWASNPSGGFVNFDVLDLETRFPTGFAMVVDGRRKTVAFLREHLKRNYRFTPRPEFFNSLFELDE